MRKLISIAFLACFLGLGLSACSESDGEDELFFERPGPANLTTFVLANCNRTPETELPSTINGVGFDPGSISDSTTPDDSNFTNTCIDNDS